LSQNEWLLAAYSKPKVENLPGFISEQIKKLKVQDKFHNLL